MTCCMINTSDSVVDHCNKQSSRPSAAGGEKSIIHLLES
jgi:hypothetical protein